MTVIVTVTGILGHPHPSFASFFREAADCGGVLRADVDCRKLFLFNTHNEAFQRKSVVCLGISFQSFQGPKPSGFHDETRNHENGFHQLAPP